MGSQQILLIVLGVIIVGIAVLVGISIFGSNADQANKDAITSDLMRMAGHAQGYYKKPLHLGGGANSFSGLSLNDLGFAGSDNYNANATYSISSATATQAVLSATSATVSGATVVITIFEDDVNSPTYTGF